MGQVGTAPRVLVAHRSRIYRDALAMVLASDAAVRLVAATGTGDEAVSAARELRPDVVLLGGWPSPDGDGATCRRIAAETPGVKVLILSSEPASPAGRTRLSPGAFGTLSDAVEGTELARIIGAVHRGETPSSASFQTAGSRPPGRGGASANHGLTDQERRVLARVARGERNEEIAAGLGISRDTVKAHLKRVFRKLNVRTRTEAAMLGLRWGLVDEAGEPARQAGGAELPPRAEEGSHS